MLVLREAVGVHDTVGDRDSLPDSDRDRDKLEEGVDDSEPVGVFVGVALRDEEQLRDVDVDTEGEAVHDDDLVSVALALILVLAVCDSDDDDDLLTLGELEGEEDGVPDSVAVAVALLVLLAVSEGELDVDGDPVRDGVIVRVTELDGDAVMDGNSTSNPLGGETTVSMSPSPTAPYRFRPQH